MDAVYDNALCPERNFGGRKKIYGSEHWSLDTILQEKGNLHLYEKLGYHRTGKIEKINEKMGIVFYEKN